MTYLVFRRSHHKLGHELLWLSGQVLELAAWKFTTIKADKPLTTSQEITSLARSAVRSKASQGVSLQLRDYPVDSYGRHRRPFSIYHAATIVRLIFEACTALETNKSQFFIRRTVYQQIANLFRRYICWYLMSFLATLTRMSMKLVMSYHNKGRLGVKRLLHVKWNWNKAQKCELLSTVCLRVTVTLVNFV